MLFGRLPQLPPWFLGQSRSLAVTVPHTCPDMLSAAGPVEHMYE